MTQEELAWVIRESAALGVELRPVQAELLARFTDLLQDASARTSLTGIRRREEIWVKHHLDSLTAAALIGEDESGLCVDVGSGAGFPGIPVAVARPRLSVALIESVQRKADFLRHAVRVLGLERVQVVQARAEELGRQGAWRERADWALIRAVGSLALSLELCAPLVRLGGFVVVMKGPAVEAEWEAGLAHARRGGLALVQRQERVLPGGLRRVLLVWQRQGELPPQWPRRPGRLGRP